MTASQKKRLVVSLDGLNLEQFDQLKSRLPLLSDYLSKGRVAQLDSSPFVDAQPIWAEVLTGAPWHENGCVGFSKPGRTLNEMQVFSERDLLKPIQMFEDNDTKIGGVSKNRPWNILINIPLLRPNDASRLWLGDGGQPVAKNASLPGLEELISKLGSYNPRPYVSIGEAMADWTDATKLLLQLEDQRLGYALALTQNSDWKFLAYRLSIFDQLSHLLEFDFLSSKSVIEKELEKFLGRLDRSLATLFEQAEEILLFSGYSHMCCSALLSMNDVFEQSRLLRRELKETQKNNRLAALTALEKQQDPQTPLGLTEHLAFLPRHTLCASPVKGAIYLNVKPHFEDGGSVDDSMKLDEEDRIEKFFQSSINKYFPKAKLLKNPNCNQFGPSFVFIVEGVELVESNAKAVSFENLPALTHASKGFVWSPKVDINSRVLKPTDLIALA
ncbi:MAG TPA: alkaline phosphatase family protein [Drouetiella sp.]